MESKVGEVNFNETDRKTAPDASSPDWVDEPEDLSTQTPLHNKYAFWYHKRGGGASKSGNYEDSILKVDICQTVIHAWIFLFKFLLTYLIIVYSIFAI
jgi:hypothetical protein